MLEKKRAKKEWIGSQITGTASSYARKYALNGLFNIDDTKDADTDEFTKQTQEIEDKKISKKEADALSDSIKRNMFDVSGKDIEILNKYGYKKVEDIMQSKYMDIVNEFRKIKGDEI